MTVFSIASEYFSQPAVIPSIIALFVIAGLMIRRGEQAK
jgi:hypothetical protein